MENTRTEFVAKAMMKEETISELCREYSISRQTAYKWITRYKNGESMSDKSHEPFLKPFKTSPEMEELILKLRDEHPTWGPRKLRRYYADKGVDDLPAPSTVAAILKRNQYISEEASAAHTPYKRFERNAPNDLWQMDYKGHFEMLNGIRCHPLTITDDHSRFNICTQAEDCERWNVTMPILVRSFHEYGLPNAILCDNGKPWGDSAGGYTFFDVWMMQMNILPLHGRPLHPQTQGKEERYHRTLKEDVIARIPIRDLLHAQEEFDKFRYCYNYERPHESLRLDVPAKHYKPSSIILPEQYAEPEYCSGVQLRKVNYKGYISVNRKRYFLSDSLIGKYIEIVPEADDCVALCYGNFRIAKINLTDQSLFFRKIYRR